MLQRTCDRSRRMLYSRRALEEGTQRKRRVEDHRWTGHFWRGMRYLVLLGLAAYLVFAHGCHGDEDDEIVALIGRVIGP